MMTLTIRLAICICTLVNLWSESDDKFHVTYFRINSEDILSGKRLIGEFKTPESLENIAMQLLENFRPSERAVMFTVQAMGGKLPPVTMSFYDRTVYFSCETVIKDDGLINIKTSHTVISGPTGDKIKDRVEHYDDLFGFDKKPLFIYLKSASEADGSVTDIEGIVLHRDLLSKGKK